VLRVDGQCVRVPAARIVECAPLLGDLPELEGCVGVPRVLRDRAAELLLSGVELATGQVQVAESVARFGAVVLEREEALEARPRLIAAAAAEQPLGLLEERGGVCRRRVRRRARRWGV
jgi:hypothetical protein